MKSHTSAGGRSRRCAWCEKRIRRTGFAQVKRLEVETVYPARFWENAGFNGPVTLSAGVDVCRHHKTLAEHEAQKEAYGR